MQNNLLTANVAHARQNIFHKMGAIHYAFQGRKNDHKIDACILGSHQNWPTVALSPK